MGNLYVGQILLLPATGEDLRVRRPEEEYVIQAGDSLGSIAVRFELTLTDLLAANRLSDPDNISIGQRLVIPEQASVENRIGTTNCSRRTRAKWVLLLYSTTG